MKKSLSLIALVAALSATSFSPALADDEHNVVSGLTAVGAPLGFHGVDPVAFIEIDNRVDGSADYTAVHDGVAYYFASEANMEKFKASPDAYTPQNGGFCTFGVSVGKKFDGDPQFADVRDGKLYVFLNEAIFKNYQKDPEGTIKSAEKKWTKIQHKAASKL